MNALTLNIELTLISIIQGVALYFLTENSRNLLVGQDYAQWPYIVTGLLTILTFWSRSIMHTLTVIRWPLEFGHNFFYIICTFFEAVLFTQIGQPLNWFALGAVYSLSIWLLFAYDLRLVRRQLKESGGPVANPLVALVEHDQMQNIRYFTPFYILFNIAAWLLLSIWPETFLVKQWHVAIAAVQLLGALGYLTYGVSLFNHLAPMMKEK